MNVSDTGTIGSARAAQAEVKGWISAQAPGANILAAGLAFQICAVIHAPKRKKQFLPSPATPDLRRLRHCLNLHRIHPGEPPDALLIQCHRSGILFRFPEKLVDISEFEFYTCTKFGQ